MPESQSQPTLDKSVVCITGGTGSFGSTMARNLLSKNVSKIRIFSRDEAKQDQMRNSFKDERLEFVIGDVRDEKSVFRCLEGVDYVFHAAALKQVPSCEFFPEEAVATNVIGSSNVINGSIANLVKSVVCLSTDKAVYPINAMGMSKALMEKVAQSYVRNREGSKTQISITRYGNVMMSRGSVIPLFTKQILSDQVVTITEPSMTRFMMSLDNSVSLVEYAFLSGTTGNIFVQKAPACTIETLVNAMGTLLGKRADLRVEIVGKRHGEKNHETLMSDEESEKSIDEGHYFRIPLDSRSLDYSIYFEKGSESDNHNVKHAFTSANTKQLNEDQVVELLLTLPEFREYK
jgi:UDP-N-acetylglucosamine 4,6-dehydratase